MPGREMRCRYDWEWQTAGRGDAHAVDTENPVRAGGVSEGGGP